MRIKYIAQSGFLIETEDDKAIGIDLWLDNPVNKVEIEDIPKTTHLLCTHTHQDHGLDDMVEIAKRDGSTFVANYELANSVGENGVENIAPGNIGGWYEANGLEVLQTEATHTSEVGVPVGFIFKVDGKTVYHMGDTGYFSTLQFLSEFYDIDILMVPIGSRFTMGPSEAAYASTVVQPKYAIPMHYNTFPMIEQDPERFRKFVNRASADIEVKILDPGQVFAL